MMTTANHSISLTNSLIGIGYSIVGKYIPGKVWAIAGRGLIASQEAGCTKTTAMVISMRTQIMDTMVAAILGLSSLVITSEQPLYQVMLLLSAFLILIGISFKAPYHFVISSFQRFFPKIAAKLGAELTTTNVWRGIPLFTATWLSWGLGFYLLGISMYPGAQFVILSLCFPLGCVAGMASIIAPGGIGIREGVIAFALITIMHPAHATTLAVTARGWFLIGELVIVLFAFFIHSSKFFRANPAN